MFGCCQEVNLCRIFAPFVLLVVSWTPRWYHRQTDRENFQDSKNFFGTFICIIHLLVPLCVFMLSCCCDPNVRQFSRITFVLLHSSSSFCCKHHFLWSGGLPGFQKRSLNLSEMGKRSDCFRLQFLGKENAMDWIHCQADPENHQDFKNSKNPLLTISSVHRFTYLSC